MKYSEEVLNAVCNYGPVQDALKEYLAGNINRDWFLDCLEVAVTQFHVEETKKYFGREDKEEWHA